LSVLITGGTGYIGAKLARLLTEQGEDVVCFDLRPNLAKVAGLGEKARVVQGDVTNLDDLVSALKEFHISKVVHLAYIKTAEAEQIPHKATRVNILGTDNVYEASRLAGVSRVLISSSVGANGLQSSYGERPVNEDDPLFPVSGYGAMKGFNEFMGRKYAAMYGLEFAALRIAFAFGHGREQGLTTWPEDYASLPAVGKPARLACAADQMYCLIYVDDVAEALARMCLAERLRYPIYFTGGHTTTVRELAQQVLQLLPGAQISFSEKPGYQAHQYIYRLDDSRIRDDLGFSPRPLRESVLAHINEARAAAGLHTLVA